MDSEYGSINNVGDAGVTAIRDVAAEEYVMIDREGGVPGHVISQLQLAHKQTHKQLIFGGNRMINTFGQYRIKRLGVSRWWYFKDIFRTMLHLRWYWIVIIVFLAYLAQFLFFALCYVILVDLDDVCIEGLTDFMDAFFFSVQTQITIGYGDMTPSPECPEAIFLVTVQSLVGLTADAMLFGLVYQRFARPEGTARQLVFSNVAVIGTRNLRPFFMFRIANLRSTQLIEAHISVFMTQATETLEGEQVFEFKRLSLVEDTNLFLALPFVVEHPIDEDSPFRSMTAESLMRSDLQIIVLVEGIEASTSDTIQARHAYSTNDILFSHRFASMVTPSRTGDCLLHVDYEKISETVPILPHPGVPE